MKPYFAVLVLVLEALLPLSAQADGSIHVVATTPDLADITQRVGGPLVTVTSLATGVEDPHGVPMKPSFVVLLNRADIVVLQGFDLEHAFLPGLLGAARNPKVQRDAPGYIDCSKYVQPLDVPTTIDRALGEQHPLGNPHYNLDPESGHAVARAIAEGLASNFPASRAEFEANRKLFDEELDKRLAEWRLRAAPLKGVKFVSYHPDLAYLAARYGMLPADTIELRAGVDPTPSHIAELEAAMKREGVTLVVRERHYPADLAATVASATGAQLAEIVIMTRGVAEAPDYFSFIDYNLNSLLRAVGGRS